MVALPPAPTQPVAIDVAVRQGYSSERSFVRSVLGKHTVLLLIRTRTRIDTGGWLPGGKVWLAVVSDGLLFLASGWLWRDPRPLVQHLRWQEVLGAQYNHVTGALLLRSSHPTFAPPPLSMTPEQAAEVIAAWTAAHQHQSEAPSQGNKS
jgi:hypothetical protein